MSTPRKRRSSKATKSTKPAAPPTQSDSMRWIVAAVVLGMLTSGLI